MELLLFNLEQLIAAWVIFLLVWLYVKQIWLLDHLDWKLDRLACSTKGIISYFFRTVQLHFDCQRCVTFWIILIFLQNPLLALSFAWLAEITSKK